MALCTAELFLAGEAFFLIHDPGEAVRSVAAGLQPAQAAVAHAAG